MGTPQPGSHPGDHPLSPHRTAAPVVLSARASVWMICALDHRRSVR